MQWRVLQELRTTPFDPGMWCLAKPGMEFLDQARLAQPRLTNDKHKLPFAAPSALPAPHEYRYFLIATDERRQMPLPRAAPATAGPHQNLSRRIDHHRAGFDTDARVDRWLARTVVLAVDLSERALDGK